MGHHTALMKDTLREIRKSFGRFISIFAIVGIGVAFFAGVRASVPVMKDTADAYYRDYNLMDIKVQSTMGLTEADVEAVKKVEGLAGVYAGYSMDVVSNKDNVQSVVNIMSMPSAAQQQDADYINQYRLMEGRMPQREDECVMETDTMSPSGYALGDTIQVESGTKDDISDTLKHTTYTIVGKVETPNYVSYEKGSSAIGSGKVQRYIAIWDTNFTSDIYTEMYITIAGANDFNSYSDAYFDYISPIVKDLEEIADIQAVTRIDEIKERAQQTLDDGWKEYDDNLNAFHTQMQDAKQQLQDARQKISDGQVELDTQYQSGISQLQSNQAMLDEKALQLTQAQAQYDAGVQELTEKETTFNQQLPQLQTQLAELQVNEQTIIQGIAVIDIQLQDITLPKEQRAMLEAQRAQLVEQQSQMQTGITQLQQIIEGTPKQLADGKAQLAASAQQISDGQQQLRDGYDQLAAAQATLETNIADARVQLVSGAQEIANNEETLVAEEQEAQAKLDDAKAQLDSAQEDLTELQTPAWYVLDRNAHYSYRDYGGAADRMSGIAKVFPLFFFLVSALVCLTTMTRMVDEQRQEIGTLKAMGYSKLYIAMKFIAYAGIASIFGGITGAIIGMTIFPTVIYNAWNIMYALPAVRLELQLPLAVTAIGLASIITIAAAVFACYKDLMETPSLLMRPKAPKNGKKIWLERIPFIWKHFSFIYKVTARNIFRYKKRFLMTVIGISGCTALLVAGFGIQDSIGAIVEKQYGELYAFDVSMTYNEDVDKEQQQAIVDELSNDKRVEAFMEVGVYHVTSEANDNDQSIEIYVDMKSASFTDFFHLKNRVSQHDLSLDNEGAIISEKLAKLKGVDVGDTLSVEDSDQKMHEIQIRGITENYVGHVLYMTSDYYEQVFEASADVTGVLGMMNTTEPSAEASFGSDYMKNDNIESINFYSSIADSFQKTISSLLVVVIVLIISAGALAFVVLYNLTNVNISERLREIATIKVLGFYDKEVSAYVYRENLLLTLIGAGAGLLLGILLHALIMNMAEMDSIMFGRNIKFLSFVLSLCITMLFAVIVNTVMYRKLKKIPMVESLKSVE